MMKLIAKIDCQLNGQYYSKGDEIQIPIKNKNQLIKLNEGGFIEPLSPKDIQNYFINKGGIIDE